MIKVIRKKDESADSLIRRFKNKCNREGITREFKSREAYMKPGERRRAKHNAAVRSNKRSGK